MIGVMKGYKQQGGEVIDDCLGDIANITGGYGVFKIIMDTHRFLYSSICYSCSYQDILIIIS